MPLVLHTWMIWANLLTLSSASIGPLLLANTLQSTSPMVTMISGSAHQDWLVLEVEPIVPQGDEYEIDTAWSYCQLKAFLCRVESELTQCPQEEPQSLLSLWNSQEWGEEGHSKEPVLGRSGMVWTLHSFFSKAILSLYYHFVPPRWRGVQACVSSILKQFSAAPREHCHIHWVLLHLKVAVQSSLHIAIEQCQSKLYVITHQYKGYNRDLAKCCLQELTSESKGWC